MGKLLIVVSEGEISEFYCDIMNQNYLNTNLFNQNRDIENSTKKQNQYSRN